MGGWLTEDGIAVNEVMRTFEGIAIAQIEGQPVHYVQGQGIYVWGQQPDSPQTLMFWATTPDVPAKLVKTGSPSTAMQLTFKSVSAGSSQSQMNCQRLSSLAWTTKT